MKTVIRLENGSIDLTGYVPSLAASNCTIRSLINSSWNCDHVMLNNARVLFLITILLYCLLSIDLDQAEIFSEEAETRPGYVKYHPSRHTDVERTAFYRN